MEGPQGPFAPLICYEIVFEDFVRRFVRQDRRARYIVNLANDGWYGPRQQPEQHLSFAVFRAVANRVPVIRGGNSGISAVIDASGRIGATRRTAVLEQTTLRATIHPRPAESVYARFGDWRPRRLLTPLFILAVLAQAAVARRLSLASRSARY